MVQRPQQTPHQRMDDKHIESSSSYYVIREMQIKTTIRKLWYIYTMAPLVEPLHNHAATGHEPRAHTGSCYSGCHTAGRTITLQKTQRSMSLPASAERAHTHTHLGQRGFQGIGQLSFLPSASTDFWSTCAHFVKPVAFRP